MTRNRMILWAVAALALIVVTANTFYIVPQREQAIVLRFGQPVRTVNTRAEPSPGLQLKVPFVENVVRLDRRNLSLEAQQEEVIAADQERLVVDAFVRYRISDPLQFYRTLRDQRTAQDRLERLANSSLRQVLGRASSGDIVSGRRAQLMQLTQRDLDARAEASNLGVDIIDVRIRRADLPAANREAVYRRMQTARQQEAAEQRAQGEQRRREIIALANRDVTVTLAQAQAYAGQVRGEGDARRADIFAEAYGRDPQFAAFYRSMQAYEGALANGQTTMVLDPDSEFFRYFRGGPGGQ